MRNVFVFAVAIVLVLQLVNSQDSLQLCNPNVCHRYVNGHWIYAHNIGCNNPDTYSSQCPSTAQVQPMTGKLKRFILHLHNKHRNDVANGNLWNGYFPQAEKMATMQWNDELEYLAQLNCLRCYYGPDACRNTANFPHVGQNIDMYWNSTAYWSNEEIVAKIFRTWFEEYTSTSLRVIQSYYHTGRTIGHFTQIISGKSAYVGCALIYWNTPHRNHYRYYMYFVCNYSFTNYVGQAVYQIGPTASQCTAGTNSDYSGLCSTSQEYDPIPIWGSQRSSSASHNSNSNSNDGRTTIRYSASEGSTNSNNQQSSGNSIQMSASESGNGRYETSVAPTPYNAPAPSSSVSKKSSSYSS